MTQTSTQRLGVFSLVLILGSVGLGAAGQALMKQGTQGIEGSSFWPILSQAFTEHLVLLGISAYIFSSALWLIVLSRVPLSVAYPFGAISYVLVIGIALLSGEVVPPMRWLGVGLITFGILLISSKSIQDNS